MDLNGATKIPGEKKKKAGTARSFASKIRCRSKIKIPKQGLKKQSFENNLFYLDPKKKKRPEL